MLFDLLATTLFQHRLSVTFPTPFRSRLKPAQAYFKMCIDSQAIFVCGIVLCVSEARRKNEGPRCLNRLRQHKVQRQRQRQMRRQRFQRESHA